MTPDLPGLRWSEIRTVQVVRVMGPLAVFPGIFAHPDCAELLEVGAA